MFIVICLYLAWVGLNTLFSGIIIRGISHPKYSLMIDSNAMSLYSSLIMFVGFPILLFRKRLRRKRMKEYYEFAKDQIHVLNFGDMVPDKIESLELEKLNRMIKLDELQRKIKRKKRKKRKIW